MCGLIGIGGDLNQNHKEAFKQLLIVDQLRGTHGTGVASVSTTGEVDWCKRASNAMELMEYKPFDRVITTSKKVLLGHNRYATLGAHNADNTHPFDFKGVVGAHNGTIPYQARKQLKYENKYDTDSEAIYAEINDHLIAGASYQEAVSAVIGLLNEGAWALTMYIKPAKKLVFLRNKERTLFYCTADEGKILAWASEAWMLYSILSRNNVKIDTDKVFLLPEDSMLGFDVPKMMADKWKEPERTVVKGAEKKNWQAYQHNSNFSHGGKKKETAATHTDTSTRALLPTKVTPLFPNDTKKGHYKPPYKWPHGGVMNKPQFETQIKLGHVCAYCNWRVPEWGEQVLFLKPSPTGAPQFICQTCIEDDEIMELVSAMR